MPCLLKTAEKNSPGIVTFNTTELFSQLFKKKRVLEFLNKEKNWIFGVSLSGSYERIKDFPDYSFIKFMLCYSKKSPYIKKIDNSKIIDISYINFCKTYDFNDSKRFWDICVVSRDSSIKRISTTVEIIDKLTKANKNFKVLLIVPDERDFFNKFKKNSYFNLIKKTFSVNQHRQIDFISSNVNTFGNHTLSERTIHKFISESKLIMINSKKEGINRAIIEGLLYGAKAVVPHDLESEISNLYLNKNNALFIEKDVNKSTEIILNAIKNYKSDDINKSYYREIFCEKKNKSKEILKDFLSGILKKKFEVEGKWYLNDLNFRLCNHGTVGTYTIYNNEDRLFEWFNKVENLNHNFIDEDHMYDYWFNDKPNFYQNLNLIIKNFKLLIKKKLKSLFKR